MLQFHKYIQVIFANAFSSTPLNLGWHNRELLPLVALRCEDNIVLQVQRGLVITLQRLEVHHEVVLDGEDGVGGQPRVVLGVELGCAALEVGVSDLIVGLVFASSLSQDSGRGKGRETHHDVNMSRSHRMTVQKLKELIRRPIRGQRVRRGVVAVQPVLALLVGPELAAQVVGLLVLGILEVVLAVGAGLPDVEDGAGDGLAGDEVGDGAVHEGDAALGVGVLDDGRAVVAEGGVGRPEGAEDGGGGGVDVAFGYDLVGDFVDEAEGKDVLARYAFFSL